MSGFTRLGCGIWDWEPFVDLDAASRMLWLALYTTAEAKRICPGLWHGGPASLAEAAHMTLEDTLSALDRMLQAELVEYDPRTRVIRLTKLPDAGDWPSNGNIIRSWWRRFQTVPACAVRDAHIRTLRWIVDQGAASAGTKLTPNHQEAWSETFGTVPMPTPRRRGVRTVADSDTSTAVQPSLFCAKGSADPSPGSDETRDPVHLPIRSGSDVIRAAEPIVNAPPYPALAEGTDPGITICDPKEINNSETVCETVGRGRGRGRAPDLASLSPELPETGPPERSRSGTPHLALVPPYTLAQALAPLVHAGVYATTYDYPCAEQLAKVHATWVARAGPEDFAFFASYLRRNSRRIDARELIRMDLPDEIRRAREQDATCDERAALWKSILTSP